MIFRSFAAVHQQQLLPMLIPIPPSTQQPPSHSTCIHLVPASFHLSVFSGSKSGLGSPEEQAKSPQELIPGVTVSGDGDG